MAPTILGASAGGSLSPSPTTAPPLRRPTALGPYFRQTPVMVSVPTVVETDTEDATIYKSVFHRYLTAENLTSQIIIIFNSNIKIKTEENL